MNNDLSGSVTSYDVTYSRSMFKASINPSQFVSCEGDLCSYLVNVPSSVCSPSTDVDVSIAAVNRIGQGSPSDAVTVGMLICNQ